MKPTKEELQEILDYYEGCFGYSPQAGDEQEQRDIEVKVVIILESLMKELYA